MKVQSQRHIRIELSDRINSFGNIRWRGDANGVGNGYFEWLSFHTASDDIQQPRQRDFTVERTAKGGRNCYPGFKVCRGMVHYFCEIPNCAVGVCALVFTAESIAGADDYIGLIETGATNSLVTAFV